MGLLVISTRAAALRLRSLRGWLGLIPRRPGLLAIAALLVNIGEATRHYAEEPGWTVGLVSTLFALAGVLTFGFAALPSSRLLWRWSGAVTVAACVARACAAPLWRYPESDWPAVARGFGALMVLTAAALWTFWLVMLRSYHEEHVADLRLRSEP